MHCPRFSDLNKNTYCLLTICAYREFGIGLGMWFGLRISHEVALGYQLGLQPSASLPEAGGYTSKEDQSYGCQIGAGYWHEASDFSTCSVA